jgi:alpha-L-fucosidase
MLMTRRNALKMAAGAAPALLLSRKLPADTPSLEIEKGPFVGTRESLRAYEVPEWFRDAKLGFWAHWGPQSAPEQGDWFAQRMYLEGSPAYKWHLENFGHPSKSGFKDVIPTFKAEKWEPEHLMDLYVKAGAKYFVSMGVHHDNFDMWNSKYQTRWNAVAAGPKRDIVTAWRDAARKRGLRFGVSEHLSNSFDWFAAAHRSDKEGPLAGVPYDGIDPAFADLYHSYAAMPADFALTAKPMGREAPDAWKQQYFNRIKDLIDQHHPIFFTPMAAFLSKNMASASSPITTTSVPGSMAAAWKRSTTARCSRIAIKEPARSIWSAASSIKSGPIPGKPTPASVTGITSATSPTKLPKLSWTC